MPDVPAVRQPTRLTRVDVMSGPSTDELPAFERALLDDLGRALNDSALLFSWYLAEAGGVPARHSFLRIFVAAPNGPERIEAEQCPASWEFETVEAPGDLSVLALQGRERDVAAFDWIHTVVRGALTRWGLDVSALDHAYDAARRDDPAGARRPHPATTEAPALIDRTVLSAADFWSLVGTLRGRADENGVTRLRVELGPDPARNADFAAHLETALAMLDSQAHAEQTVIDADSGAAFTLSDDLFLYARCAVVASGPTVWARVVADPAAFAAQWDLGAERLLDLIPSDSS